MQALFRNLTLLCVIALIGFPHAALAQDDYMGAAIPVIQAPINDIAMATLRFGQPVIIVNPQVMAQTPKLMQEFFMAHEVAHHILGHVRTTSTIGGILSNSNAFFNNSVVRAKELEADNYAIRSLMAQDKINSADEFAAAVQMCTGISLDHPLPQERARQVIDVAKNLFASLKEGDPLAAKDIEVTNDVDDDFIKWRTNGNPPEISFNIKYKNRGARTVRCTVLVASGHRPRDAGRGDMSEWKPFDTETFTFSLGPGQTHAVRGNLKWFRLNDTMPTLRFPSPDLDDDLNYISCKFINSGRD